MELFNDIENLSVAEFIHVFRMYFPDIVNEMNNTEHGLPNSQGSNYSNLHHVEGSIWTHTMMVMMQAEINNTSKLVKIAALLHDVGKPNSINDIEEEKKRRFLGHEGVSFYKALEPLHWFLNMGLITKEEVNDILILINHHGTLNPYIDTESNTLRDRKNVLINRWSLNPTLFKNLVSLVKVDSLGRFHLSENNKKDFAHLLGNKIFGDSYINNLYKLQLEHAVEYASIKDLYTKIYLLVGPESDQKTYWIINNFSKLQSSIIDIYEITKQVMAKHNPNGEISVIERDLVYEEVEKQLHTALQTKNPIIINGNFMSRKSRRRLLSVINSYITTENIDIETNAVVFKDTTLDLYNEKVLEKAKTLQIPLYDEIDKLIFV